MNLKARYSRWLQKKFLSLAKVEKDSAWQSLEFSKRVQEPAHQTTLFLYSLEERDHHRRLQRVGSSFSKSKNVFSEFHVPEEREPISFLEEHSWPELIEYMRRRERSALLQFRVLAWLSSEPSMRRVCEGIAADERQQQRRLVNLAPAFGAKRFYWRVTLRALLQRWIHVTAPLGVLMSTLLLVPVYLFFGLLLGRRR